MNKLCAIAYVYICFLAIYTYCSSAKTLVISFVGMQTQEVTIKPHVKVILKSDSELLEEVVVTGYGTFKKASFTGAASTVNTSTLEDVPVLSVAD